MPKPVQSKSLEQFRVPVETLPPAPKPKQAAPTAPLPRSVQSLIDQHKKTPKSKPVADEAAIARELSRQGGIQALAAAPKPKLQPMPPGTKMPAKPQASPSPDCFTQGLKTAGTCVAAGAAAAAGVTAGPAEVIVLGAAGFACGTEVNDFYRCVAQKP